MTIFQRPVNFKLSLVAMAIALFALSATADKQFVKNSPDRVAVKHAHSQVNSDSAGEAVELLVELRVPGGSVPIATLVEYILLVLNANGEPIGEFMTSAPVEGYANVRLETAIDPYGLTVLLANGETLGPIEPERRSSEVAAVDYAVEVRVRKGINPQTGETIRIPASTTPRVSSFVFDKATGRSLFANDCSAAQHLKRVRN
jgi:hypothetical protein